MSIFKNDRETKRMIFNVYTDVAERLDRARELSRSFEKRLDVDTCINKALEKFLHKAEKKLEEMQRANKDRPDRAATLSPASGQDTTPDPAA